MDQKMFLSTFNIIKFTVQMLAKAQMAFFHFIYFSSFDFCLLMLIKPNRDVRHWNGESNHISTYIFIFIYIIRLRKILSCHFFVCILFQLHFMIGWLCVRQFIYLIEKRTSLVKIVRQLAIEFMLRLSSISVG